VADAVGGSHAGGRPHGHAREALPDGPVPLPVGKVWAKTGTLSDVVALAGFTKGADGRLKAFAFLVNGKDSSTSLKQNIDMLAATVNGCY